MKRVPKEKDGFITAGGFDTLPIHDLKTEGSELTAHYLTSKVIESDKLQNGRGIMHTFMTEQGELVGVWGAGQLDFRLKAISMDAPGALTRITYLGKGKFKNKKGKMVPVHNYDVKYNPEKVVDVPQNLMA